MAGDGVQVDGQLEAARRARVADLARVAVDRRSVEAQQALGAGRLDHARPLSRHEVAELVRRHVAADQAQVVPAQDARASRLHRRALARGVGDRRRAVAGSDRAPAARLVGHARGRRERGAGHEVVAGHLVREVDHVRRHPVRVIARRQRVGQRAAPVLGSRRARVSEPGRVAGCLDRARQPEARRGRGEVAEPVVVARHVDLVEDRVARGVQLGQAHLMQVVDRRVVAPGRVTVRRDHQVAEGAPVVGEAARPQVVARGRIHPQQRAPVVPPVALAPEVDLAARSDLDLAAGRVVGHGDELLPADRAVGLERDRVVRAVPVEVARQDEAAVGELRDVLGRAVGLRVPGAVEGDRLAPGDRAGRVEAQDQHLVPAVVAGAERGVADHGQAAVRERRDLLDVGEDLPGLGPLELVDDRARGIEAPEPRQGLVAAPHQDLAGGEHLDALRDHVVVASLPEDLPRAVELQQVAVGVVVVAREQEVPCRGLLEVHRPDLLVEHLGEVLPGGRGGEQDERSEGVEVVHGRFSPS